ncbi:unnamed protein product [Chrysoparadoxa australica]
MNDYGLSAIGITDDLFLGKCEGQDALANVTIKRTPQDFQVNEVLLDKRVVKLKNSYTSKEGIPEVPERQPEAMPKSKPPSDIEPEEGWHAFLEGKVGSEVLERFAAIDADQQSKDEVVLPASEDKAARSQVHRAIKELYPFVLTKTSLPGQGEANEGGGRTMTCTRSHELDKLRSVLTDPQMVALQAFSMTRKGAEGKKLWLLQSSEKGERRKIMNALNSTCCWLDADTGQREGEMWVRVAEKVSRAKKRKRSTQMGKFGGWVRFVLRKSGVEHYGAAEALTKALKTSIDDFTCAGLKDKQAVTQQLCAIRGVTAEALALTNGTIEGVTVGDMEYVMEAGNIQAGELYGNRFRVVLRKNDGPVPPLDDVVKQLRETGFINYYGTQRVGSNNEFARRNCDIGKALVTGNYQAAAKAILRPRGADPALTAYERGEASAKMTLRAGKQLLKPEQHSVLQALVRAGEEEWEVAIKKLPYRTRQLKIQSYQSWMWNQMASKRVLMGAKAMPGDLLLASETRGQRLVNERNKKVEILTTEALAASSESPEALWKRVVLPLPGLCVQYPTHSLGEAYAKWLEQNKMSGSSQEQKTKIKGVYRTVVAEAEDLSWGPVEGGDGGSGGAAAVEFTLGSGCFATMCLRELTRQNIDLEQRQSSDVEQREPSGNSAMDD